MLTLKKNLPRKSAYAGLLASACAISTLCGYVADNNSESHSVQDGWAEASSTYQERDPYLLTDIPQEWVGTGAGRTRLLYQDYRTVTGETYRPRAQLNSPSCVANACAAAVDILTSVEIARGEPERLPNERVAVEPIYGLSRQEIGGLSSRAGGGSHCIWAAQAVQQFGVVYQKNYALIGIDLSEYSTDKCREYGSQGVPDSLELLAQIHPVQDYIRINNYADLRDAIYNGCPCIVGSSQGFGRKSGAKRDSDGFLSPPFWTAKWKHAMAIIAICDDPERPGALIINSWGPNWISGNKKFGDEPDGSFWVDKKVLERMIAQDDCYALRNFKGFPYYKLR